MLIENYLSHSQVSCVQTHTSSLEGDVSERYFTLLAIAKTKVLSDNSNPHKHRMVKQFHRKMSISEQKTWRVY